MIKRIRFRKGFSSLEFQAPAIVDKGNSFIPSLAIVPLTQHYGPPAIPVVQAGSRVKEGQLIARSNSPYSSHIHAPIPGLIREFTTVPLPDGSLGIAAVMLLEGSFSILGRKQDSFDWRHIQTHELLRIFEEKGVINTFDKPLPLSSLVSSAAKKTTKTLVVRMFDEDPTCMIDSWLATHKLHECAEGAAIIARSMNAETVYFVSSQPVTTSANTPQINELFTHSTINYVSIRYRYPSGNTKTLTRLLALTEQKNPPVMIDMVTALAARDAVKHNMPTVHNRIIISGPALYGTSLLRVKSGTTIGDIIEECGGFKTEPSRIIINGLVLGQSVYDLDTPVTKATKSLHVMNEDTCPSYTVRNCIHCGKCLAVCPAALDPARLVSRINTIKKASTDYPTTEVFRCEGCGCCSIVCPSRIPLHHIIREAAEDIKGQGDAK